MKGYYDPATLEKCVLELVLNSLKAKATAVAVRIDVLNRKIQVVDNGLGINKNFLRHTGEYPVIDEGFSTLNENGRITRGGSLVNIRVISSVLMIMSKSRACSETYGKIFSRNQTPSMTRIENRPTTGTTVTVYFSRGLRNWCDKIDSFAMRYMIAYLALVNKEVSFSVRDDSRGSILLRVGKHQKSLHLLRVICERSLNVGQLRSVKIRVSDKVKIRGFWGLDCTKSKKIQQVLLNLRPVHCSELERVVIRTVTNICCSRIEKECVSSDKIFFLLYIGSSDSEYNLSVKNGRFTVKFDRMDRIIDSIEKIALRAIDSKKSKRSTVLDQPLVPSPICRSAGQKLGSKQMRAFIENVNRHSFKNGTIFTKNQSRQKVEMKNCSRRFKEIVGSNREDDQRVSLSRGRHQVQLMKDRIDDVSKGLQMNRKCNERFIEKSRCDTAMPISRGGSLDEIPPVKESEPNSCAASSMRQSFRRSQRGAGEPASQKSLHESPTANLYGGNTVDAFPRSDKLFEKLQDIVEPQRVSQTDNRSSTLKEYQYDNHGVLWISQKCAEKLSNNVEEMDTLNDCSQWSDWIYEPHKANCNEMQHSEVARQKIYQRFRFLPLHLHALLPYGDTKIIGGTSLAGNGLMTHRFNLNFNHRRQDLEVRPCIRRSFEVSLKLESLQSMKVLNQVNREFIVALTQQDDKKLLVVIDQHAMDERLRYEKLLRAYRRDQKNHHFSFVHLHRPVIISDLPPSDRNLISTNQRLLIRYGLNVAFRNNDTLLISTVPRCFSKKSYHADHAEMENAVRKLLQEVLDGLNSNGIAKFLPLTIHDALASEACHGAIKFGDPLTMKQCKRLVACWKETEAPNRCAHGRPSMIPLLELSSLKRNRQRLAIQEKLNFASLRNSRGRSGNTFNRTARYHPYDGRTVRNFGELLSGDETSR